jgi:ATP adenylyltransferase
MDTLFSPWRSKYIEGFKDEPAEKRCVFCEALARKDDKETLLIYRGSEAFVIMNRFPYNSGHLLVIPNRHTNEFAKLRSSESEECQRLLVASHLALTEMVNPNGFNIGMNLGRGAGAGIDDHLHWHIVPRWNGDTNFMSVLADVKLVSEDIPKQWRTLHERFPAIVAPY